MQHQDLLLIWLVLTGPFFNKLQTLQGLDWSVEEVQTGMNNLKEQMWWVGALKISPALPEDDRSG